jgi:cell envelope opacity-associated protein A
MKKNRNAVPRNGHIRIATAVTLPLVLALAALHSPAAEERRLANAAIGERFEQSLTLPPPPGPSLLDSMAAEPGPTRMTLTIASGDTLSGIFRKAGLRQRDLLELLDIDTFRAHSRNLRPGQELEFTLDTEGRLRELALRVAPEHTIRLLGDGSPPARSTSHCF